MKVLVDSSVWVGHFKQRNEHLVALLEADLVVCHPFVVAEVACGTTPSRKLIISMLSELNTTRVATQDELLVLLEARHLYGQGCGFVDLSLLASALLDANTFIWTLDKRLNVLANQVGRAFTPRLHS